MKHDLLIYIPSYQRQAKLKNCIDAISLAMQGNEESVRVIVSNNGSTDGTKEYLDALKFNWLKVIHRSDNVGFYQNVLGAFCFDIEAEYLWIIGDDDYLMPTAISGLLKIIRNYPVADYIFCNTKAFDPSEYESKFNELRSINNVTGGIVKSKHFSGTELVKFNQIINPAVADTLLGELMVNCYKFSAIKMFNIEHYKNLDYHADKIDWGQIDIKTLGEMSQPHNLPIIDCFSGNTVAVYCDEVRTFNFWGTAEWLDDYDLAFPCVIFYLIQEYKRRNIIDHKQYLELFTYFLNAMGPSLLRQVQGTTKAKKMNSKIRGEIFDALLPYLYSSKA